MRDYAEWRRVVGCGGRYEVSDDGRVRSLVMRGKHTGESPPLKAQVRNRGRLAVNLHFGEGRTKLVYVHSVVAAAFIGPRPAGLEINHKDGCKDNNHAANLEYVSRAENMAHGVALGLFRSGERVSNAKLTEASVLALRADSSAGMSVKALAWKYGVSGMLVRGIVAGRRWRRSFSSYAERKPEA